MTILHLSLPSKYVSDAFVRFNLVKQKFHRAGSRKVYPDFIFLAVEKNRGVEIKSGQGRSGFEATYQNLVSLNLSPPIKSPYIEQRSDPNMY